MHLFLLAFDVVAGDTFLLQFLEAIEELVRSRTIGLFCNKPRTVVVNMERVDFARALAGDFFACLMITKDATVDFTPGPVQRLVGLVHELHPVSVLCQLEREHEGIAAPRDGPKCRGTAPTPEEERNPGASIINLGRSKFIILERRGGG